MINGWHNLVGLPYLEEIEINENLELHYYDPYVYSDVSFIYDCPKLSAFTGTHTGISEDHRSFVYNHTLWGYAPAGGDVYTVPDGLTGIIANCFVYRDDYSFTATTLITPLTIKEIVMPDTITSYSAGPGLNKGKFDYKGFMGNYSITSITLSSNLVSNDARGYFSDCTALTSVNIPSGFTGQTSAMFQDCWSLESVVLPEGMTHIDPWEFIGCSSLKSVSLPTTITEFTYTANTNSDTHHPGTGVMIRSYFMGCNNLTSITSNNPVCSSITIDQYTFEGVGLNGKLYSPKTSDYSTWLSFDPYYLGYYG